MPTIIGLGHYSRTGKTSLAQFIESHLDRLEISHKQLSFARKLKEITHDLYGWAGLREPDFYETAAGAALRQVKLPALGLTPVEVWVKFGNAARSVYAGTWLDYALNQNHESEVIIVPDVRFPNEFDALMERGAYLIKVVRPGYGPLPTDSDRALLGESRWDRIAGPTMDDLNTLARALVQNIATDEPLPEQSDERRLELLAMEKLD